MAAHAPVFTVLDAITLCGVNSNVLFNGDTQAQRIATEIFDDDHQSVMDKTIRELQDDFKSYSALTVANGQIRLTPGITRNIKAYMQWAQDCYRTDINPDDGGFN